MKEDDRQHPESSPWGTIMDILFVAEGVYWVVAHDGRGGLMIAQHRAKKVLSSVARVFAEMSDDRQWLCYEDKRAVAIPLFENPAWSLPGVRQEAAEEIREHFPGYFTLLS